MLVSLFAYFRLTHRQRRQQHQMIMLSKNDAKAFALQVIPQSNRVLIIRNDSIGDYLLYRPWLRQLTHVLRARGQQLTLLANILWVPLLRAWDADLYEEVIAVDFSAFTNNLSYRSNILQLIGKKGFNEVIYPLHVREAAVENFIQFLKAPVRIVSEGANQTSPWLLLLNSTYSQVLPSIQTVLFEYYRNKEFFENWCRLSADFVESSLTESALLALPPSVHEEARIQAATIGNYIVLFPGASARQKRWPTHYFAQVAQQLHYQYAGRYKLVIAGSGADDKLAQWLIQQAGPAVPFDNRCGQTDLQGLAALLAGAQLVISNDTVAAHLAAQSGTPCLVLIMGENYGKFFPYPPSLLRAPCLCLFPPSQERRFAQGDFSPPLHDPNISKINVIQVLIAAKSILDIKKGV